MRREECVCGGVLFSHGGNDTDCWGSERADGIRATVVEHNQTPLHVAWVMAGGFDSGLVLSPMRKPPHREYAEPGGLDAYEGNLFTGTMG